MANLETHIAVNKNRLKEYSGGNIYLPDNSNFQIELFNGKKSVYGAEIFVNGEKISDSKLMLRPGERVFLDRFLDRNRKFLFETYNVGNNKKSKSAIKNNGKVMVRFYRQKLKIGIASAGTVDLMTMANGITLSNSAGTHNWNFNVTDSGNLTIENNGKGLTLTTGANATSINYVDCDYSPISTSGIWETATYTTTSTGYFDGLDNTTWIGGGTFNHTNTGTVPLNIDSSRINVVPEPKNIETGRVSEGKKSNQKLDNIEMEFEDEARYEVELQILPESNRSAYVSSEIRNYCTGCGTRSRRGWQYCASCGNKL